MQGHHGCRIQRFQQSGQQVLSLENDQIRLQLLPDKGSEVVSLVHKSTGIDVLWHRSTPSKAAPAPMPADATGDAESFLDSYGGGWQECLPNGGTGNWVNGRYLPFHGEVARLPWKLTTLADSPERVSVLLEVETPRSELRLAKTLTLTKGQPVLEIEETLENMSQAPVELMWGHHPAIGGPFLDETCRIDTSATRGTTRRAAPMASSQLVFGAEFDWPLAPLIAGGTIDLSQPQPSGHGTAEWVCLSDFEGPAWYAITSQRRGVGFGMRWDAAVFPYIWFWQVWNGEPGYPWYGREYCCALEPWTSTPDDGLSTAIANGTSRRLAVGETLVTRLVAVVYEGMRNVTQIDGDGRVK